MSSVCGGLCVSRACWCVQWPLFVTEWHEDEEIDRAWCDVMYCTLGLMTVRLCCEGRLRCCCWADGETLPIECTVSVDRLRQLDSHYAEIIGGKIISHLFFLTCATNLVPAALALHVPRASGLLPLIAVLA